MSERVASSVSTDDHRTPAAATIRPGLNAAYLAAPLWALQAVIWIAAPKVQEQSAPYTITNPVLFALFWLSIAGAIAFSAAAASRIPAHMGAPGSRVRSAAVVLAVLAAALAAAATVSIAVALIPAAQPLALTLMTNLLNAATVILAASLILSAVVSWRARHSAGRSVAFPVALAAATVAMIIAILASGTQSVIGLYFAVAVAVLNGVAWWWWGKSTAARGTNLAKQSQPATPNA